MPDLVEAQRRVDPLLGGRAVSFEEMIRLNEGLGRHVDFSYWLTLEKVRT